MTKTILFVDDSAICREPIAAMLSARGYTVSSAVDGLAALAALAQGFPDLILLDVAMPRMGGIEFLKRLRAMPEGQNLPVILLTAAADRELVLQAKALNAQEYLLKSQFSLQELLKRIQQHLDCGPAVGRPAEGSPATDDATATGAQAGSAPDGIASGVATDQRPAADAAHAPQSAASPAKRQAIPACGSPPEIPQLLDRETTIRRMEKYGEAKTLAGVVAEVIQLSSSSRGDMGDLAGVLSRDAVLATRVLQVANSATFASNKPRISTIEEAVRNVGLGTVRKIAATVGIFGAFPPDSSDGFNSVRCWQHCLAVAEIMDQFQYDPEVCDAGIAHLVGLCHDLGEIVLRQNFAEEHATAVRLCEQTGRPMPEVEQAIFGLTHEELAGILLEKLGLPATIVAPIREYFANRQRSATTGLSPIAQALRLANLYAHGLLLASSADSRVYPVKEPDCRSLFGGKPPAIDRQTLRAEVVTTTNLLARLSPADETRLSRPLLDQTTSKIVYCRHPAFDEFDPLGTALQFLAHVEVRSELPCSASDVAGYDGVVIVTPRAEASPFSLTEVHNCRRFLEDGGAPALYLTGVSDVRIPQAWPGIRHASFPISLSRLRAVLEGMAGDHSGFGVEMAA